MFNPSSVVIEAFVDELVEHYVNMFGENSTDIHLIVSNARNALEIIANSDADFFQNLHTKTKSVLQRSPIFVLALVRTG